jgi:hypothetical protein
MTIIRPNSKPAFWWLVPWAYARTLHTTANALKAYADRLDEQLDGQRQTIRHLLAENYMLQQRVRDQDDAIIKGTAITPDAHPHE